MARASISINLSGIQGLREGLASLKPSAQSRILGDAMGRAAKPIAALARAKAPADTGALRRAIGSIVRRYPNKGLIMGLIGALRGYYKPGKKGVRRIKKGESKDGSVSPAKYSHLVERGHRIAKGGKLNHTYHTETSVINGKRRRRRTWRVKEFATGTASGYVLPRPFLAPAAEQGRGAADAALADGFGLAIEAEFKRAKRKFDRANRQ